MEVSMYKFISKLISLFKRETIRSIAFEKVFFKNMFATDRIKTQNVWHRPDRKLVMFITDQIEDLTCLPQNR